MKGKWIAALLVGGLCATAFAAPPPGGHRLPPGRASKPMPPPPPPHRPRFHARPAWGWGVNVSPWGGSFSFGTRVGRHGALGFSVPLAPPPVVERTIIVQAPERETVIIQAEPQEAKAKADGSTARDPGILPAYAPSGKTWVDGYWKVTRDLDGNEISRSWVPGHWE